ncbi:Proline--tRNA ligase [Candidatus Bealeia paramacronuclearis]|uniref:Proline--tRNA ligase n=1 Tax=Candidatus Bealeia paramacronuclearis TaxID=1921001 RepID=A0ABZ2C837_9PROT|nr:Proline--tRNA ligase [Candidatus Bealeia paramacronuclearis]
MRISQYFLSTLKETPQEAQIVSHRLMLRTGMIAQTTAGIYTWLPLGLAVLKKIEQIVREEQNRAGSLEVLMPTIQPADLWIKSGRYNDYGKEMLRITDRHEREMLYGPTAEEVITDIFARYIKSYKDLPKRLYNIQWKFRDEIRPRFGVMRGREFLMKDNYSFNLDYESARASYQAMLDAYVRTFARMGLTAIPVRADSGAIGGTLSHEFQILAETGESQVYYDEAYETLAPGEITLEKLQSLYAAADEMHKPEDCPVPLEKLKTARGIEVGHVFYFGTKYSIPLGAYVMGPDGKQIPVEMGSYGIGVSRLVGALIEANHDEKGIIWPESVAPFKVGILNLNIKDEATNKAAEDLYHKLLNQDVEVLYDDRDQAPGAKFADMDLIGLPWQIIVGPRGVAQGRCEVKNRKTDERFDLSYDDAIQKIRKA